MDELIVRPIQDADLPDAAAALVKVHATDGYPVEGTEDPKAWISSSKIIQAWVAENDGQVVGHVAIMSPQGEDAVALWQEQSGDNVSRIAILARLFVLHEVRDRSVGKRLMRAAMEYAHEHDMRLVLDVMIKDTAAIRLYERLGWHRIGDATHRYGDDQSIEAICYVAPR